MDTPEKIAREAILALISVPESTIGHRSEQQHLASVIRAYGDQCRRAGAEAAAVAIGDKAVGSEKAASGFDAMPRRDRRDDEDYDRMAERCRDRAREYRDLAKVVRALPSVAEAASPGNQIEKLQAFKDYVHKRLDDAGIPTHPNGAHSKEGCRIGDRLDIILAAEALSMLPRAIPSGPEAASPAVGWRPIETAPKDGTTVWLRDPTWLPEKPWRAYTAARWVEAKGRFESGDYHHATATHWMPLPSAPSEEARAPP